MLPHDTRLGSPRPRKDSADSIRIAAATSTPTRETTGASALGSTWVKAIRSGAMPIALQPATKSRDRRLRISARTNRAGPGDRKSVVEGQSVQVRVDRGGRRLIKKKNKI